ncbi:clathrin interactor 1-like isoform X3 [Mizuhopecten yessoensis]|uniref:clathrin interactor 1-like isoform X3 n=1 Tax=Mizuhopecten yessoensis TaxID=6573 RepID=UPI000B45E9B7|nr:clathrin interactor 1-like isoform X3 [Mizuhopecten yessoensis]
MFADKMWKLREITDKVTNVVMNYSEVETKVREATSDEAWGPHGSLMQEVARFTFTYEHFPEVMGMLWKRMLHDNKKNWRRVYKSLLLLTYLLKNGSERVVTSSREHLYDLRSLESYTFTDEHGKDQGLNVRQKIQELLDFIQNDEKLRDERKKAKKNKDKYVGVAGEGTLGNRYSDRYDEEPSNRDKMDEIEEWDSGRKTMAGEAVDKVKGLWNKVQGRKGPDDVVDYSDEPENRSKNDKDDFNFKDDDAEYTSVERTHTTRTEKITHNRRSRSAKKLDLGAASSYGKDKDSISQLSGNSITNNGSSLIDMGLGGADNSQETSEFADFKSANSNGDFNPRGATSPQGGTGDFADFSQFQSNTSTASTGNSGEFADFTAFNAAGSGSSAPPPATKSGEDNLFDMFGGASSAMPAQQTPNIPMPTMGSQPMAPVGGTLMGQPMASMGNFGAQPVMMGMPQATQVPMQGNPMNMPPQMQPTGMMAGNMYAGMPNMGMQQGLQPMIQGNMMAPGLQPMGRGYASGMGMQTGVSSMQSVSKEASLSSTTVSATHSQTTVTPQKDANTWSKDASKVNISLDALSPANKFQKPHQPSMNQLQQQDDDGLNPMVWSPEMAPGLVYIAPGMNTQMVGLNQGMAGMSVGQPQGQVIGGQPMMGQGMGMAVNMQGGMGMMGSMNMQSTMMGQSSFQQRTDQAFSGFGNTKK